jgi:hypothetical protein
MSPSPLAKDYVVTKSRALEAGLSANFGRRGRYPDMEIHSFVAPPIW